MTQGKPEIISQGVQQLIDDIREKGVAAGQAESERLIADAKTRATWIIEQAEEEAAAIRAEASKDGNFLRQSGREALNLAMRDVLLKLQDELSAHLSHQLEQMVALELRQPDTLAAILASIAARIAGDEQPQAVLLPETIADLAALKADPKALFAGELPGLLGDALRRLLANGIELLPDASLGAGCKLRHADNNLVVAIDNDSLSAVLLAHLQPRFRALLQGVVKSTGQGADKGKP